MYLNDNDYEPDPRIMMHRVKTEPTLLIWQWRWISFLPSLVWHNISKFVSSWFLWTGAGIQAAQEREKPGDCGPCLGRISRRWSSSKIHSDRAPLCTGWTQASARHGPGSGDALEEAWEPQWPTYQLARSAAAPSQEVPPCLWLLFIHQPSLSHFHAYFWLDNGQEHKDRHNYEHQPDPYCCGSTGLWSPGKATYV